MGTAYLWNRWVSWGGAGGHNQFVPFFITPVRLRGKLDDGVQGNLDVGQVDLREIVEVAVSGGKSDIK